MASTGEEVWHVNCDRTVRERSPALVQSLPAGSLDANKTKKLSPDNRDVRSKYPFVGKACVCVSVCACVCVCVCDACMHVEQ